MSDIGADVFAEWGVVPENVVPLSIFSVVSRGWLVVECIGIRIRRVLFGMAEDALSDERDDSPPRELPPTIQHKEHTGQHQQKTVVPFILQSILRPSRSDDCGYRYTLHYEPPTTNKRKNRQQNKILWYNPPFSRNVSTNIAHRFLALVGKHCHISA